VTHRHARHALRLLIALGSMGCSSHSLAMPKLALESATWTKMVAPPIATARAANVFVYDEARDNCVVFGGRPVDDHGFSFYDTGLWSGDTWVPVAAEYGRRGDVTGAFDRQRQRTVVYGGTDGLSFFADTWEFDGSGWTRRKVASPGTRSGNGLAYDARRNVTVLFGGYNGSSWKDELWEWDGETWAQGCIAAPCSVAPRPAARTNAVFVFDDARGVSLLFGGSRDGHTYDDTWSWDGERWQELHPAHVPLARGSAAATYDPVSKRVLLFGGLAAGYHDLNDFWAWDGRDWSHISQTTVPFARHGARMAWHAQERRGILFGGSASGRETDAWEFKLHGTPCTVTSDCHVGTCVRGSCAADPDLGSSTGGGSTGGANSNGGESGGQASGGCSGNAATLDGGSGGDKPTSPDGGAVGGAWGPPKASGGAGGGGASVANPATPLAEDDSPAIRSFYSCALSAPSRTTGAPLASTAILAGLVTWFSRRRSKLPARVARFSARDR
jgi:hypothetical protein